MSTRKGSKLSAAQWATLGVLGAALIGAIANIVTAIISKPPTPTETPPPPTLTSTSTSTLTPTSTLIPTSTPTPLPPFSFCQDTGMGGVETVLVNPPRYVTGIRIDLKTRHTFENQEKYGFSLWEVEIYGPDTVDNLAIGATAFASSEQNDENCIQCTAAKAIDGDNNSRWASESFEPQRLQIDFSTPQLINNIILKWQDAYAEAYCIRALTPEDVVFIDFIGEFITADALGNSDFLSIKPDKTFHFSAHFTSGETVEKSGNVEIKDGKLHLTLTNSESYPLVPKTLIPVKWGMREYLIKPDVHEIFCETVKTGGEPRKDRYSYYGYFLIRGGDWNIVVTGKPTSPDGKNICG